MLHQVQYVLCREYHENWRVWVLRWWGGGGDTILVQVCVLYCVTSICCWLYVRSVTKVRLIL